MKKIYINTYYIIENYIDFTVKKNIFMMENQVFWTRYIEISHSGEEQIPDTIYRGSDFEYTMP